MIPEVSHKGEKLHMKTSLQLREFESISKSDEEAQF